MKQVLFMVFMLSISFAFSQKQISIEKTQSFPDFKVRIAKELLNSDLKIEIGKDISFADFSVRVIPNKLLGVGSMAAVPLGLITVPFIENVNKFQNPFRRPLASLVFLIGTFTAFWLGIGACLPISQALTLGFF